LVKLILTIPLALSFVFSTVSRAAAPDIGVSYVPPVGSYAELTGWATNVVYSDYKVAIIIRVFGGYWTKPYFAQPLTTIQNDGTWHSPYNTGGADGCADEFRCYLVTNGFQYPLANGVSQPPAELESNSVAKVLINRSLNSREIFFSGYEWICKSSCGGYTGPGPNVFSDSTDNIFLDTQGRLHLRITFRNGQWQCAEIISKRSFGYGTYIFQIDSVVDGWHPSVVAGFFTWSDQPDFAHRETDVEISPWQGASNTLQFVRQPYDVGTNLLRFPYPAGLSAATHTFDWRPQRIYFRSFTGNGLPPASVTNLIRDWTYSDTNQIPVAGGENARINLWLNPPRPTDTNDIELVVTKFVFIPVVVPAPQILSITRPSPGLIRLGVAGDPNLNYSLLGSTNFATWDVLTDIVATNALFYLDDLVTMPIKFYRIRLNR
jgi:hypothetical protein